MCLFFRPTRPNNDPSTTVSGWGRLLVRAGSTTIEVRSRRVLARLFKEPGEVVGTAVAFALLSWWGVLGNVPLWALLGILLVSGLLSTVIDRLFGRATSTAALHVRMAASAANTGVVIYATGWGPMLAIGYV